MQVAAERQDPGKSQGSTLKHTKEIQLWSSITFVFILMNFLSPLAVHVLFGQTLMGHSHVPCRTWRWLWTVFRSLYKRARGVWDKVIHLFVPFSVWRASKVLSFSLRLNMFPIEREPFTLSPWFWEQGGSLYNWYSIVLFHFQFQSDVVLGLACHW